MASDEFRRETYRKTDYFKFLTVYIELSKYHK